MNKLFPLLLVAGLAAAAPASAFHASTDAPADAPRAAVQSDWIAKRADNLVGLRDVHQLSNPALLNFKRCLGATPEMKKMKKDGITPESPEGIRLKAAAVTRVTKAADTVRTAGGYCSVWKTIKHKDGRRIPDLTTRVVGQY